MYKRLFILIPVIILVLFLAGTMERSYTEPEIINGALSRAPNVHTAFTSDTAPSNAFPSATDVSQFVEASTIFDTTAVSETTPILDPTLSSDTSPISEATAVPDTTAEQSTQDVQELTVYWVKSGEVWHTRINCASLSRSKSILSGTLEEAMYAGKARVCKRCG